MVGYELSEWASREASERISTAEANARADADAKIGIAREEAKTEIAKSNAAIELARKETSEANARALEAKLALEKLKQPRTLEKRIEVFAQQLKPFTGTRFDAAVIPGDPEAAVFFSHVTAALEAAGWKWIDWNPPGGGLMMVFTIPGKPNVGQLGFFGVTLQVHPEHAATLKRAAEALGLALIAEGIEASLDVTASDNIPNKDTIHVIVGKKRP
jgi:hypothetical protein